MRKIIIILLLLGCVSIGAWYFFKPSSGRFIPADVFLQDTLLMIEFVDLEEQLQQFETSKLGQKLKEIDVPHLLSQLGAPAETVESYKQIETSISTIIDSMVFKSLFGKQVSIALLPVHFDPSRPDRTPDRFKEMIDSLLVIARPKHGSALAEFISHIFSDQLNLKTFSFLGYKINHFDISYDQTVYYASVDGLLVAALNRASLEKCLTRSVNGGDRLSQNEQYQYLQKRLNAPAGRRFIYADTQHLTQFVSDAVNRLSCKKQDNNAVSKALDALRGLKAVAAASYDDNGTFKQDKLIFRFDPNEMGPILTGLTAFPPEENKTIRMTPGNILFYVWTAMLDLKSHLTLQVQSRPHFNVPLEKVKKWIEKEAGVDFDDAVKAFGNQFGFVLADVTTGGLFPYPHAAIYIEVERVDIAKKIISSAIDRFKLNLQQDEFEGVAIHTIIIPFGGIIQPAYAFFDGFGIISTNKQMIRDAITISKNGGGLIADKDFKSIDMGLTDKNNRISFIKSHQFFGKIKSVIGWGSQILAFRDRNAAMNMSILVHGAVNPLLDGLTMYRNIGSRTVIKENEIETDIFYQVEK